MTSAAGRPALQSDCVELKFGAHGALDHCRVAEWASIGLCGIEIRIGAVGPENAVVLQSDCVELKSLSTRTTSSSSSWLQSDCVELKYVNTGLVYVVDEASIGLCGIEIW